MALRRPGRPVKLVAARAHSGGAGEDLTMIDVAMQDALNQHIDAEIYSAQLYLAMSAYLDTRAYKGFGRWLRVQYQEELEHANKMLDHVLARGGQPQLGAIQAPPREFGTLIQVFEAVVAHERQVTARIHALHAKATEIHDTATQVFLHWFINEQVEEEERATEILDKLRMVGVTPERQGAALYLDKEYGKRKPGGAAT